MWEYPSWIKSYTYGWQCSTYNAMCLCISTECVSVLASSSWEKRKEWQGMMIYVGFTEYLWTENGALPLSTPYIHTHVYMYMPVTRFFGREQTYNTTNKKTLYSKRRYSLRCRCRFRIFWFEEMLLLLYLACVWVGFLRYIVGWFDIFFLEGQVGRASKPRIPLLI